MIFLKEVSVTHEKKAESQSRESYQRYVIERSLCYTEYRMCVCATLRLLCVWYDCWRTFTSSCSATGSVWWHHLHGDGSNGVFLSYRLLNLTVLCESAVSSLSCIIYDLVFSPAGIPAHSCFLLLFGCFWHDLSIHKLGIQSKTGARNIDIKIPVLWNLDWIKSSTVYEILNKYHFYLVVYSGPTIGTFPTSNVILCRTDYLGNQDIFMTNCLPLINLQILNGHWYLASHSNFYKYIIKIAVIAVILMANRV